MVRRRYEGWPSVLSRILRENRETPFSWGTNDCLMFPADVVLALTGFDPAAEFRGTYSTYEESKAIVEAAGGVEELITQQLGVDGIRNVLSGQRGDIVTMKTPWGIMGGVVDDSGARIAVPLSDQKTLMRFPLEKAWRRWNY